MSNYELNILRNKDFSNVKIKSVEVKKKNKGSLNINEIRKLAQKLMSKQPKDTQMAIQVLSPLQRFHIKGFEDNDITLNEIDDYLEGRVKEHTKFTEDFSQVILTFKTKK